MIEQNAAYIKKLTWQDVRNDVARVNQELAKKIDELNPGNNFVVYKAGYPFGSYVLKDGVLNLPNAQGELIAITDPQTDAETKKLLGYALNMPVGIVLNHTMELYWMMDNHSVPFRFMLPGRVFALWALLQKPGTSSHLGKMWNITAGTRSLMLLPKVSEASGYRRLKKEFALKAAMPTMLSDQWPLLCELANAPEFSKKPWYVEVLYFSETWLQHIKHDPAWIAVEHSLMKAVWNETSFLRDDVVFNFAFSKALANKNLRPNPYLTDTVKQLYSIGRGCYAGFKVARDDSVAPCRRFQKIFDDLYDLRFSPTMVHPGFLVTNDPFDPLYYSLELPTLAMFSPKSRKAANKLNDIREIKHIQNVTAAYILEDSLGLKGTPLYHMVDNISYDYFHSDYDSFGETQSTMELIDLDKALQNETKKFPDKPFCHTSTFLRGCVRISSKRKAGANKK